MSNMNLVAIDIETRTAPLESYPAVCHAIKKFGTTVLAPITDIALYAPEGGIETYDMRAWDPWLQTRGDPEVWHQIRNRLCDPDTMIIGHNVIFDLRHIGAHYNFWFPDSPRFHLPLGCKVWDTQTIAYRMLLGEQKSKRSPFGDSFAIAGSRDKKGRETIGLSERLGLLTPHTPDWEFYIWMKEQRDNLSRLAETLATLDIEHVVWHFLGGWVPPNRPDLLEEAARQLLTEYVSRDAILAFQLYEKQQAIADQLVTGNYNDGKLNIPRWPELTQRDVHPAFDSLLDFWTRRLRLNANRAAQGMQVRKRYVKEQLQIASSTVREMTKVVMSKPDKHDPYPKYEDVFSMMLYYEMLLNCLRQEKHNGYSDPTNWALWKPIKISPLVIEDALADYDPTQRQVWLDYLANAPYASKKEALSAAPPTMPPTLNLIEWTRRNCYQNYEEPFATFLAEIKTEWMKYFYKTSRASIEKKGRDYRLNNPLKNLSEAEDYAHGLQIFKRGFNASRKWVAYYMFCVANAPLPTNDEFKYIQELTTTGLKKKLAQYNKDHNGMDPDDYREFVVINRGVSYGKGAMEHFLTSGLYDTPDLEPLKLLMQAKANLARFKEIRQHSALDGAVHSIITNKTTTGRGASGSPNMQNVKMAKKKPNDPPTPFPGTFRAPKGMVLTEWDYSNAEVRMGNMIARDDVGAAAAESGDYHRKMAELYKTSAVWNTLSKDEQKTWRNYFKPVTFSIPYGAGAGKVALLMKSDIHRAKEVIDNRKRSLWATEEQKKKVSENAKKRHGAKCVPVYVSLWDYARVQVSRGYKGIDDYTAWNSLQQGGVTSMISRADVIISETLEREGYKTFVQQDIHDSLIIAFDTEEYLADNRALPVRIAKIMGEIMPDELCERTTPKTHFVTNLGPENAKKWGKNPYREYQLPLDEFVNQWGVFPLPEGAEEAPTWTGDESQGWTLEKETQALEAKRKIQAAVDGTDGTLAHLETDIAVWMELQTVLASIPEAARLLVPIKLVYKGKDNQVVDAGHLPFPAWMTAGRVLLHNGNGHLYLQMIDKVKTIIHDHPDHFADWCNKYEGVLLS